MKQLDINITKAKLVSFNIGIEDNQPSVTASIALLTEGGKKITEYTIHTHHWEKELKFDLPIEALPLIGALARVLERVVVVHCRDAQQALAPPKIDEDVNLPETELPESNPEPARVVEYGDELINLDDIPF